ncbi:MAG: glycosyltransferase [Flavihumibacter sp.]
MQPVLITMPAIVYYIDPFLAEHLSHEQEMLSNALGELAASLPAFQHYILSFFPQLEVEADPNLHLLQLVVPKISLRSHAANKARAFTRWKGDRRDVLLVQFSAAEWLDATGAQTLLISTAADMLSPAAGKTRWASAGALVVPFEQDRLLLLDKMPALAGQLSVVLPALEEKVESLGWAGQEQVKLKYSGGRDYLLYIGPLTEAAGVIHLMKAYSLFKNWLLTGMPLVLAGTATEDTPHLEKLISTYKYKNDVFLYTETDTADQQSLAAGAYMLVLPRATDHYYPVEWAFSAGTAVVAADDLRLREWAGSAADLADPADINLLANSMMVLYKNEESRSRLIEKGRERAEELSREKTLAAYAAVIQRLLPENG